MAAARLAGADARGRPTETGGARLWVPAGLPRAEVLGPSADLRGDRDLPVLIVAGRDLAGGGRRADQRSGRRRDGGGTRRRRRVPDPPLAHHTVALLNRGTPGCLAGTDGTLHIGLMRGSSAWPAGVWIDGEQRTAPDGSSFAWQHWSHTFEYALAAGEGGWREAGFTVAGQEYNRDLIACEGGGPAGPLAGRRQPVRRHRPRGDARRAEAAREPAGAGRPGPPRRAGGVTVRLRDAGRGPGPAAARKPRLRKPGLRTARRRAAPAGSPAAGLPSAGPLAAGGPAAGTAARVHLFTAPGTARLTSLLEDAEGPPLPLVDGVAEAVVTAAGTVTLALARVQGRARGGWAGGGWAGDGWADGERARPAG